MCSNVQFVQRAFRILEFYAASIRFVETVYNNWLTKALTENLSIVRSVERHMFYQQTGSTEFRRTFTLPPGPEVIKLFSSSAQLSMKFQLLINAEIVKISGKFRFNPQKLVIYPADKC